MSYVLAGTFFLLLLPFPWTRNPPRTAHAPRTTALVTPFRGLPPRPGATLRHGTARHDTRRRPRGTSWSPGALGSAPAQKPSSYPCPASWGLSLREGKRPYATLRPSLALGPWLLDVALFALLRRCPLASAATAATATTAATRRRQHRTSVTSHRLPSPPSSLRPSLPFPWAARREARVGARREELALAMPLRSAARCSLLAVAAATS